jgi:ABC-type transport system substrate-binding protein
MKKNMKLTLFLILSILIIVLVSCQSATTTPIPTSTPPGLVETSVAATIYFNQTSTARVEQAVEMTLAAAFPSPTNTPPATPTPDTFRVTVPASACWVNSGVDVRTGQKVVITASGVINTWEGREGSNSDPKGQSSICGAIECPKQGAGYGALIGRLENLPTFFAGTEFEFVATKDGQLYFTVNDWGCEDNSGAFELVIILP